MKIHRILQSTKDENGRKRQIVLALNNRQEYVTWEYYDDTKYCSGHYFSKRSKNAFRYALKDFQDRITINFGLNWLIESCARQYGQAEIIWEKL